MQKVSGRFASALLLVVLVMAALGGWWWLKHDKDRPANSGPQAVPVVTATVVRSTVPVYLRGIGNVEPLRTVTLRPRIEGILTELHFEEGGSVKRGQILAVLDDRAIAASLQQAEAEKARNQALLATAEADLRRYQSLLAEHAIARQAMEQQESQVAQLRAGLQANDAAIAANRVQLSYTRITSPIDGRAGLRRVDPGNLVSPGNASGIVTVTQLDPVAVVFTLPQQALPRLQALLHRPDAAVMAYDRAGGEAMARGRLLTVDNLIDAGSGTVKVKAEFPNAGKQLWPGQFVTMQLESERYEQVLTVPLRAVQEGREYRYVYRVRDGKAEAVPVRILEETDDVAIIAEGLAEGDVVVADGQSRLKPGSPVRTADRPAGS